MHAKFIHSHRSLVCYRTYVSYRYIQELHLHHNRNICIKISHLNVRTTYNTRIRLSACHGRVCSCPSQRLKTYQALPPQFELGAKGEKDRRPTSVFSDNAR